MAVDEVLMGSGEQLTGRCDVCDWHHGANQALAAWVSFYRPKTMATKQLVGLGRATNVNTRVRLHTKLNP